MGEDVSIGPRGVGWWVPQTFRSSRLVSDVGVPSVVLSKPFFTMETISVVFCSEKIRRARALQGVNQQSHDFLYTGAALSRPCYVVRPLCYMRPHAEIEGKKGMVETPITPCFSADYLFIYLLSTTSPKLSGTLVPYHREDNGFRASRAHASLKLVGNAAASPKVEGKSQTPPG
jgi:hypothetical protein